MLCVLCFGFRWFVGGCSACFKESSVGWDGVRGGMAFGYTTQTLSCHKIAVSSTEYQPTTYTPHVIADMKMRPCLKYMGVGAGPAALSFTVIHDKLRCEYKGF